MSITTLSDDGNMSTSQSLSAASATPMSTTTAVVLAAEQARSAEMRLSGDVLYFGEPNDVGAHERAALWRSQMRRLGEKDEWPKVSSLASRWNFLAIPVLWAVPFFFIGVVAFIPYAKVYHGVNSLSELPIGAWQNMSFACAFAMAGVGCGLAVTLRTWWKSRRETRLFSPFAKAYKLLGGDVWQQSFIRVVKDLEENKTEIPLALTRLVGPLMKDVGQGRIVPSDAVGMMRLTERLRAVLDSKMPVLTMGGETQELLARVSEDLGLLPMSDSAEI